MIRVEHRDLDYAFVFETVVEYRQFVEAHRHPHRPLPWAAAGDRDHFRMVTSGWTPEKIAALDAVATKRSKEVIRAAIRIGHGATTAELAQDLGSSLFGIGKRVEKVKIDAASYDASLPPPISLVGVPGRKTVSIDSGFDLSMADQTELELPSDAEIPVGVSDQTSHARGVGVGLAIAWVTTPVGSLADREIRSIVQRCGGATLDAFRCECEKRGTIAPMLASPWSTGTPEKITHGAPVLMEVRELEALVNREENSLGLLEARIRIQSQKLDPLPMLPTHPPWLAEELEILLAEDGTRVLPVVIAAVEQLVRAASDANPGGEARLQSGPRGSVEVIWGTEARIRWLVQPGRIRWPGVEVRAYRVVDPTSGELCAQSFWTAHTLVADFARTLARFGEPDVPGTT